MSHLPGRLLAHVRHRDEALYEDLGRQAGSITAALAGFDHPAAHREFYWDVASARAIVAAHRAAIDDGPLAAVVDRLTAAFDEHVAPIAATLPRAVVHGDINDHNVLVEPRGVAPLDGWRLSGIVDFGDMVYSYRVADLAIAVAYAMLDADDPLRCGRGRRARIRRARASRRRRAVGGVRARDDASLRQRLHCRRSNATRAGERISRA